VDNTNGGTKQPSDFTITVSGNNPSPATFPGSSSGVSVRLNSGTYEVTQNSMPDYSTSYSSGCSGTANGVPISCIVTSQYQPTPLPVANLLVTKNVISNDRGTKKPSDFMIFVTGNSPSPNNFHGSTSGTSVSLQAGNYKVIEPTVSGYATTYSPGCSGSIMVGETVNCILTNEETLPTPFVDTQTMKLGKSIFLEGALRPLADVGPSLMDMCHLVHLQEEAAII